MGDVRIYGMSAYDSPKGLFGVFKERSRGNQANLATDPTWLNGRVCVWRFYATYGKEEARRAHQVSLAKGGRPTAPAADQVQQRHAEALSLLSRTLSLDGSA